MAILVQGGKAVFYTKKEKKQEKLSLNLLTMWPFDELK